MLLCAVSLSLAACGARLSGAEERSLLSGHRGPATIAPGAQSAGAQPGTTGSNGRFVAGSSSGPSTVGGGGGGGGPSGGPAGHHACTGPPPTTRQVGITPDSITVANVADITGPVPGLFQSAQQATQAFVTYWNTTQGGVCGRTLKLESLDSRTESGGDRDAVLQACSTAFAMVGSQSAFDQGGAPQEQACGIPDTSAAAVTPEHQRTTVTYAANSTKVNLVPKELPAYFAQAHPQAVTAAAFLYINAGASADNGHSYVAAYTKYGHGWNFVYTQGIDVSTFNYAPYVQQMQQKHVRFVEWVGAYQEAVQLAQAMQQQGFKPDVFLLDPTGYNAGYAQTGGTAVDGTYVYINSGLFEEAAANPELALYEQWLQRVAPGAVPSYFGVFAWSAARLFVTLAERLGPDLSRATLLTALRGVHAWTGNGIHSPQEVGAKRTGGCESFIRLRGSTWQRVYPASSFVCEGDVDSGVEG